MNDKVNPVCAYRRCPEKDKAIRPGQDRAITKDGNFHLNCWFSWRVDTFYSGKK